jgi:hypothetical protein
MANMAVVYDRRVDNKELTLTHAGTAAPSLGSFMLLFDTQTKSCWWEGTGKCLKGAMDGKQMRSIAYEVMPWKQWRRQHPHTLVFTWRGQQERNWSEAEGNLDADARVN